MQRKKKTEAGTEVKQGHAGEAAAREIKRHYQTDENVALPVVTGKRDRWGERRVRPTNYKDQIIPRLIN